jgi:hypothetical protein
MAKTGQSERSQDHESLPNDDGVGKKHEHYHGTAIAENTPMGNSKTKDEGNDDQ